MLPRYARRTCQLEALIASAYLAGTNTRRVPRALGALFRGAVGKDVVSRAWPKFKADWEAWGKRDLAGEDTQVEQRQGFWRPVVAIALCATLGIAAPARAQDMQDAIGRLPQGLQGGQPQQQDQRGSGPQRRGEDRRPIYDERADPSDRIQMLDDAERPLDAQQRQIDDDRRRIEQESRRLSR